MEQIRFEEFLKVDIRVGRIVEAVDFPEARKPAYKLTIDFGSEIGIKKSSAQITDNYAIVDLRNRLILAVVNFPQKQIGQFMSEVLVLGVSDSKGAIILVSPENSDAPLGSRVH